MQPPRDPRVEMAEVMVQIKARFQQNLRQKNRNATSKLSKTLEIFVSPNPDQPTGIIKGNDYHKYIDEGRGPGGGFTTIKAAIIDWMEAKGVRPNDPAMSQNSLASAITWKIIKKGYKGNQVFTEVIEQVKNDTNLFTPISTAVAVSLLNIPDKFD